MKIYASSLSYKSDLQQCIKKERKRGRKFFIFDVSHLPDPYKKTDGRIASYGDSEEVAGFLLRQPEVIKFLKNHQKYLKELVGDFKKQKIDEVAIFYECANGIQVSVFVAETISSWLKENVNC